MIIVNQYSLISPQLFQNLLNIFQIAIQLVRLDPEVVRDALEQFLLARVAQIDGQALHAETARAAHAVQVRFPVRLALRGARAGLPHEGEFVVHNQGDCGHVDPPTQNVGRQ